MRNVLKGLLRVVGICTAVFLLAAGAAALYGWHVWQGYVAEAEKFPLESLEHVPERSTLYDANGELYSHLPGANRQIVALDQVNDWFLKALLAREDSHFYEHQGVDYRGVARAALANFRGGKIRQGASTISQQLARNAFDLRDKTLKRKALEAALAMRLERSFTKQQLLEKYVNRVYFGSGFYGVEAASRGYFAKPAAELSLGEAATLAGLICSPNRYSPLNHLDLALGERDVVLERMREEGCATAEEISAAKAAKLALADKPAFPVQMDYFTDSATRALAEVLDVQTIQLGGLKVYCTLDPQLQKAAEAAAEHRAAEIEATKNFPHPLRAQHSLAKDAQTGEEKPTEYLQAAVVMIDNATGAVRACVGGRSYEESKYQRALISKRQIGSTFKPFVYAAAFERGLLPGSLVSDDKLTPAELPKMNKPWSPANSDGDYLGLQPAAVGLIRSRNTMAVRVGQMVGLPAVKKLAASAGVGDSIPDYPVTFLGAFETTLRDLTAAYTVFPNKGLYRAPHLISKVENSRGEVIYSHKTEERQVMRPETAWLVTGCLQEVMHSGTAAKSAQMGWKKPAGGKTGTTNDFFDAWFVGYSSSLTCGVWVGLDQPQTIMPKGYGGTLALPIWVDAMKQAPPMRYAAGPLAPPVTLAKVALCSASGACASAGCTAARTSYVAELPANSVPAKLCTLHPEAIPTAPLFTNVPTSQPMAGPAPGTYIQVGQAPAPVAAPPAQPRLVAAPQPSSLPPTQAPQIVSATGQPIGATDQLTVAGRMRTSALEEIAAMDPPEPTAYRIERTPRGIIYYHRRSAPARPVEEPAPIVRGTTPRQNLNRRPEVVEVRRAQAVTPAESREARATYTPGGRVTVVAQPVQERPRPKHKFRLFSDDDDED